MDKDAKHVATHVESVDTHLDNKHLDLAALSGDCLVKSPWDDIPITSALWTFRRSILYCFLVFSGGMLEGFEIGMAGSILANEGFIKQFGTRGGDGVAGLDPSWVSAWSAVVNVGQISSMVWVFYVADRFGRKTTFIISWTLIAIALVCLTVARTPSVWMVGRLFTGMGVGINQALTNVYLMEVCATRIRGTIQGFGMIWNYIGSIMCAIMMDRLNNQHSLNWQLPVHVVWAPVGVMLICFLVIPESPWFYARHENRDKAICSLKRLYGNVEGYDYDKEYIVILRTLEHEKELLKNSGKWTDIFKGMNGKRTAIVVLNGVTSQLTGSTMIYTYSTYFFSLAGFENPFLINLIMTIISLAAAITLCLVIDRFGRRKLVAGSYTIVTLALWVIGSLFYVRTKAGNNALIFLACVWQFFFVIAAYTFYLLAAEIPTAMLRVKTVGFAITTNAIFGIATSFATPPMLLAINLRTGFIYGSFMIPCIVCLWYWLPETKGRSASEIDELFERRLPAWKWAKTKTVAQEQLHQATRNGEGEA